MLVKFLKSYGWQLTIVAILVVVRFINLDKIPIFGDEALYLFLADEIKKNPSHLFDALPWGVFPMISWTISLADFIKPHFINPLVFGRTLMVFFDLISAVLIFLIGKRLFARNAGIFSAIIYLSIPLNFLHSRLVLLESITNLFTLIVIFLSLKILEESDFGKKLRIFWIVLVAVFLNLAFFTKPLAVVSFAALILIPVIYFLEKKLSIKNIPKLMIFNFLLALGSGFLLIFLLYLPIRDQFSRYIVDSGSLSGMIVHFKANIWRTAWWLNNYLTIPILVTTFLVLIYGLFTKNWRVTWLLIWVVSAIILSCWTSKNYYPRHLYPLVAPIVLSLGFIFNKLSKMNLRIQVILLSLLLFNSWISVKQLIFNPYQGMALEDRQQFYDDWTSGDGMDQIALKLKQLSSKEQIIVFTENLPMEHWVLSTLYSSRETKIIPSDNLTRGIFLSKEELNMIPFGKQAFLVLNRDPESPASWPVEFVFAANKGSTRKTNIYQVNK